VRVAAGPGGALDAVEGAETGDRHLSTADDLTHDGVEDGVQGVVGRPARPQSLLQLLDEICLVHVNHSKS
jgi:hypothetical protein